MIGANIAKSDAYDTNTATNATNATYTADNTTDSSINTVTTNAISTNATTADANDIDVSNITGSVAGVTTTVTNNQGTVSITENTANFNTVPK